MFKFRKKQGLTVKIIRKRVERACCGAGLNNQDSLNTKTVKNLLRSLVRDYD